MNTSSVTHRPDIDLNLLRVFQALIEERQVTRAAKRLGLSQPALSNALARLRESLGDPLFVRVGREMVPSERALSLEEPLRRALVGLEEALSSESFDPQTSTRVFRIATADYCEFTMLPALLSKLGQIAPSVSLELVSHELGSLGEDLATRRIDLAVGNFRRVPAHCFSTDLFREDFRCVVRADHPSVGKRLTLKTYAELGHVLVTPGGTPGGVVDDVLAKQGLRRRIALSTPHFLVPPRVVAESDLISTLARRVAEHFAKLYRLRTLKPPVPLDPFDLHMIWHRRTHEAASHAWLRGVVQDVCRKL